MSSEQFKNLSKAFEKGAKKPKAGNWQKAQQEKYLLNKRIADLEFKSELTQKALSEMSEAFMQLVEQVTEQPKDQDSDSLEEALFNLLIDRKINKK